MGTKIDPLGTPFITVFIEECCPLNLTRYCLALK